MVKCTSCNLIREEWSRPISCSRCGHVMYPVTERVVLQDDGKTMKTDYVWLTHLQDTNKDNTNGRK